MCRPEPAKWTTPSTQIRRLQCPAVAVDLSGCDRLIDLAHDRVGDFLVCLGELEGNSNRAEFDSAVGVEFEPRNSLRPSSIVKDWPSATPESTPEVVRLLRPAPVVGSVNE